MSWTDISEPFSIDDVGARLLENLAEGIYSHEAVLREYAQNACDSYKSLVAAGGELPDDPPKIHIEIEGENTISIQDFGLGMDAEDIKKSKRIAVSDKIEDLDMVGFRGIGIWAGYQACERLELLTTKLGNDKRFKMEIAFAEILKNADKNISIAELLDGRINIYEEEESADIDESYTRVRLIGLASDYKSLTNPSELKRIVSQILPCKIDPKFKFKTEVESFLDTVPGYEEYSIEVGGEEVYKSFPAAEKFQSVTLKVGDIEIGRAWWITGNKMLAADISKYQLRNFRLRVKNFAVGKPGIYDEENGDQFGAPGTLPSRTLLQWHAGEIYITHHELRPDTPRNSLEANVFSGQAISAIRTFYSERTAESRARSDFKTHSEWLSKAKSYTNGSVEASQEQIADAAKKLREQLTISKSRSATDKAQKKILREMLAQRSYKKDLNDQLKLLTKLQSPGIPVNPEPEPSNGSSSPKATAPPSVETPSTPSVTVKKPVISSTPASETAPLNHEELLSEIIAAVESVTGSDDELYTAITEKIYSIFEGRGLLGAEE